MEQNKQQIQIQVSPEDLKGRYSNIMKVQNTKEEFVLDYLNVFDAGSLVARIILSPGHLKRIVGVLQGSLKKYEETFGLVEPAKDSDKAIGFKA